jgi:hypothetical protein
MGGPAGKQRASEWVWLGKMGVVSNFSACAQAHGSSEPLPQILHPRHCNVVIALLDLRGLLFFPK